MSAKLPARVNTLAPAGVWNLQSLPAGDLKMGQIKGMHNEGGEGETEAVFTQSGSVGADRDWPRGCRSGNYAEKRKGLQCAQAPRPARTVRLLPSSSFFAF